MQRRTTMVREYINQQAFATDEQQLGREGWSVESTASPNAKQGFLPRHLRQQLVASDEQIATLKDRLPRPIM